METNKAALAWLVAACTASGKFHHEVVIDRTRVLRVGMSAADLTKAMGPPDFASTPAAGHRFAYRFGEPAWGILYVDGKRVGKTFRKRPTGRYPWYGKGKKLGEYRLALGAQDLAGNQTSTREFTVRLRYVELLRKRFRPRAGKTIRVRVSSDAETLTWRLGSRSGTGKPPVLKIPVPSQPGAYTLTVRAAGHRARATVVVRR